MATLPISATHLFARPINKRDFSPSAAQNRFSRFSIHNNVDHLLRSICAKPFKSKELKSKEMKSSCSSSSFSSVVKAMTEAVNEATYESKTVRVKFELQKKCMFGERFLLVGNGPILGLWDPASAIPMEWSDDHIWTAELDLPVGKSFQFKFILKGDVEEVFWQPGRDRILETWETKNTIVVSEDWENAEKQKISEEPSKDATQVSDEHLNVADLENTETQKDLRKDLKEVPDKHLNTADNKVGAVADDITFPREEAVADKYAYLKEKTSAKNKTNKIKKPSVKPKEGSLVAEDIFGSTGIVGETVLVPGLTHMTEASFGGTDEAEDPGMPEEHEKQEDDDNKAEEETIFKAEEKCDNAAREPNVEHEQSDSGEPGLTMKQFLKILGFDLDELLKE